MFLVLNLSLNPHATGKREEAGKKSIPWCLHNKVWSQSLQFFFRYNAIISFQTERFVGFSDRLFQKDILIGNKWTLFSLQTLSLGNFLVPIKLSGLSFVKILSIILHTLQAIFKSTDIQLRQGFQNCCLPNLRVFQNPPKLLWWAIIFKQFLGAEGENTNLKQ